MTRITFHKRSGPKDAQRDVLATLVLMNGPPLLIQEETDATTEKRFAPPSLLTKIPTDCPSAVEHLAYSTAEAPRLFKQITTNLKNFPASADLHVGLYGPFSPADTGGDTYDFAIGVHHPGHFEAYGWFTVYLNGKVTLYSMALDLMDDAPVSPSKEALQHFRRFCQGK